MENYLNALSVIILFFSLFLVSIKKIRSYIKIFRLQSIFIATIAGILGFENFVHEKQIDLFVICLIIIALKVIYIPNLLRRSYESCEYKAENDYFLDIPWQIMICCLLVVFSYFCMSNVEGISTADMKIAVINSISVVLIGFVFMINRKKAISQIIGFLSIENGLFVTAIYSTTGMPFIVDIGIFIDLITAILIMGVMVFKINELFESINTNKLKNLRG